MKTIVEYLVNNHVQNKKEWHWPIHGISNETLQKCKNIVNDYVLHKFGKANAEMRVKLFKETYKEYLEASCENKQNKNIKIDYEFVMDRIDTINAYDFEICYIPQGWYHYISWKYENNL